MQRPPLFESDSFIYWKNIFETYVKSKDLDLWHVITNGDFQPVEQNSETKLDETRKKSSDEDCLTSGCRRRRICHVEKRLQKFLKRRVDLCGDPNHLIGECPKESKDENQIACVRGSWSDSGEEDDEKVNNETCLVAQASSEICLGVDLEPDEWIKDSESSKHMTGNRKLFSTYKAYNEGQICNNKYRVTFSEHDSEITKDGKVIASKELARNLPKLKFDQHFCDACKIEKQAHASHKAKNIVSMTRCLELFHMDLFGPSAVRSYGGNRYTLVILDDYSRKVEESLNVTFDKTPPPSKTSPLVDDDLDEEEAVKVTEKKNLENGIEDETLEIDEIVNIKESRNHPLENNVNEALMDDSWIVAMQEELNQFIANDVWELVPQAKNMTIIGTKWVFRNKLDENGIVLEIRLVFAFVPASKRLPNTLTLKQLNVSSDTLKALRT
ncbi:retrovirus-related pol polyprotein from transposon TNT 1-94 [Tanacetum coccineum]